MHLLSKITADGNPINVSRFDYFQDPSKPVVSLSTVKYDNTRFPVLPKRRLIVRGSCYQNNIATLD